MDIKKYTVRIIAILAAFTILGSALYVTLRERVSIDNRLIAIEKKLKRIEHETTRLTIRSDGFRLYSRPRFEDVTGQAPTLLFVGHIYPRNGLNDLIKTRDDPLGYLVEFSRGLRLERNVFGGDNVRSPTPEALTHLRQLKTRFPLPVRYLLGNHDAYWKSLSKTTRTFREIYGDRYGYEDVDGVRLVYLHTIEKGGQYRLDEEQVRFLSSVLEPDAYRYALVFLHHALWAGDTRVANAFYKNAAAAKAQWMEVIVPILQDGNVRGVFSGDGGWRKPGQQSDIAGIPHFVTGWSKRIDIPPEWLTVTLSDDRIRAIWHKYFNGEHFVKY